MTQHLAPTAPAYQPAAIATLHALADTIADRHLPTPQYVHLYRHRMPTDQFEAAAAEHGADIITQNDIRFFRIKLDLGDVDCTLTCFETRA